ncbi:glycosyltransferase [Roseomonas haemaphysalidis]|uniref:Glycosyltransferase n=1 Tax=Roseomonas haemaphysalidis TaxID=2768162 RepID=A0ABS3KSN0_9PROT|nr:glycosyltransferase [Roseomonas haemaphysalidis]MBO1080469.1 glycosyltransferase [Roseomonas haemaphysalidis]
MIPPFSAAPLRVAIFVTNAAGTYGGGRLAAFLLAHCLARAGAAVSFVTNAKPVFFEELRAFGAPGRVALHLTRDFHAGLPEGGFDAVVIIPGQSQERQFYMGARGFARRRGARLVLFNFETPNWFNSHSPAARSEDLWLEWRRCIEDGCLVLSNSAQSMRFAERYYVSHPATTRFGFWHQPVNVQALAGVAAQYREDRVVCFVRARDPHKGGQDLIDLLSEDLRGWTLSLIVGSAKLDEEYREAIVSQARRFGIGVEVKPLLTDTEKFVELKRARMLVYPSLFEGYGIPPIEALSAGTPCVCYDLPVFREVCGDALIVAAPGDVEGLRAGVRRVIATRPEDWAHLPQAVAAVRSIEHCGQQALNTIHDYVEQPLPTPPVPPPRRGGRLRVSPPRRDAAGWLQFQATLAPGPETPGFPGRLLLLRDGTVLDEQPAPGDGAPILLLHPDATPGEVRVQLVGADAEPADTVLRGWDIPPPRAEPAPPAGLRHGGLLFLREAASAVVTGWAAADPPPRLRAYAGTRRLWLQAGRARPDVMAKLGSLPPQAPGFSIHLDAADLAALEAAGTLTLLAAGPAGTTRLELRPQWQPAAPSLPELSPASAPALPPPAARLRRAEHDEYGVAEFEGWVLASPRVDVIQVWLDEVFLGETVPDRLLLHVFEKHRAYGDAFCGFQFTGRLPRAAGRAARYRIAFCQGERVVLELHGEMTPTRRANGPLGSDAALLPEGLLDQPGEAVAVVVQDASLLDPVAGAARRALLRHLRDDGQRVVLVLHGNPHRFSDDLPRWRALADGVLLVNPLNPWTETPPGFGTGGE